MKPSEVREMTDADISARIAELEEERFRLKFRAATETLEDPLRLRFIRRDIARLHTIARERALGIVRTTEKKAPVAKKGAARKAAAKKGTAKKAAAKKATKASGR